VEWDPSVLDHDFKEDEQWGAVPEVESSFDEFSDYKHSVICDCSALGIISTPRW
jgi:hypothetical protein